MLDWKTVKAVLQGIDLKETSAQYKVYGEEPVPPGAVDPLPKGMEREYKRLEDDPNIREIRIEVILRR